MSTSAPVGSVPHYAGRVTAALLAIPTQPLPLALLLVGGALVAALLSRPDVGRYAFNASGEYRLDTAAGDVAWCLPRPSPTASDSASIVCSAGLKR